MYVFASRKTNFLTFAGIFPAEILNDPAGGSNVGLNPLKQMNG